MLSHFNHVWFFATPWTVACQAPLSMKFFQARILEWVVMPSSRVSSPPRVQTWVSYIKGRFFTTSSTREAQKRSEYNQLWLHQYRQEIAFLQNALLLPSPRGEPAPVNMTQILWQKKKKNTNKVNLCLYEFIVQLGTRDTVVRLNTQNLKFQKNEIESRIHPLLNDTLYTLLPLSIFSFVK